MTSIRPCRRWSRDGPDDDEVLRLTRVYHRLIRMWAKG
ncbi:hypothetical protein [Novosphingobium sp.]